MSKMTDKEIIVEALEHCIKGNCSGCPNLATEYCSTPKKFQEEVLNLINRQQAELDNLKRDTIPKLQDSLKRANKYGLETDKENEQLKAEIERLQEDSKRLKKVQMQLDDAMKTYSTIKAEAIKEYKEKLREHAYIDSGITGFQEVVVDLSDIENIADEMVGECK